MYIAEVDTPLSHLGLRTLWSIKDQILGGKSKKESQMPLQSNWGEGLKNEKKVIIVLSDSLLATHSPEGSVSSITVSVPGEAIASIIHS